ncbi:MAG: PQQ-binding-like beta-propeller repeat protein [Acidobacteriota bacterium]
MNLGDAEAALPAWDDGRPQELWRVPLGPGFSAVTVVGDGLFTLFGAEGKEVLARFEGATGRELWRREVGPLFEETWGDGPRSTPAVAGDTVFAIGSGGTLVAVAAEDGRERWRRELVASKAPRFGYSPSPLVSNGRVIVEAALGEAGLGAGHLMAFDAATGAPVWSAGEGAVGYSSPLVLGDGDLAFLLRDRVQAISDRGEELWSWTFSGGSPIDLPIAMPLALAPNRLFVAHRADGGSALLGLSPAGPPKVLWESRFFVNHLSSAVAVGGDLYGFHNATLAAVEGSSGSIAWRLRGLGKGSLIAVGDHLLVLSDRGELLQMKAGLEAGRILGRFQVLDGKTWTAPSYSDGRLYLRNHHELVALDLRRLVAVDPSTPKPRALAIEKRPRSEEPAELDLPALLDRLVEALGGAERLRIVKSLSLAGRYAFNSEIGSFEIVHQRPDILRRMVTLGGETTLETYDGEIARTGGAPLGAERAALLAADAVFLPAPAAAHLAGWPIASRGRVEAAEGELIEVEVTLPGGTRERWRLDPETALPRQRSSHTWAYDRAWDLVTRYSDYRRVAGLRLPHRIEEEFSSLYRLFEVETVTVINKKAPQ